MKCKGNDLVRAIHELPLLNYCHKATNYLQQEIFRLNTYATCGFMWILRNGQWW